MRSVLSRCERLLHRLANERHGKILRDFALAAALVAVVVEIVADLRRDHDLVALLRESACAISSSL